MGHIQLSLGYMKYSKVGIHSVKFWIHSIKFGIHLVKRASKIITVNDYRIALQLLQNLLEKQLKEQCYEIFASDFFHESSSPKPLKITRGS